jgi:glycosyltransferase involved in cell wall biosynthesis
MSYSPFISIITIVYNDAIGLKKTVESVVSQDYTNKEYIVIDGGSTDGSADFIKNNEKIFSYWVSEGDKGIADAFNKGIMAAEGDWIVLLNAGDYFQDSNAISRMIPYLNENQDADIVYGKLTEVDGNGIEGKSFGKPFSKKSFERECTIIHPATFHNKSFFQENGLFSLDFKIAMDYEIFLRKRDLKAIFADEFISKMEVGGVSQQNPSEAYKEVNEIKRLHLNKSELSLNKDYYENMLRYRLSKLKNRIFKK